MKTFCPNEYDDFTGQPNSTYATAMFPVSVKRPFYCRDSYYKGPLKRYPVF